MRGSEFLAEIQAKPTKWLLRQSGEECSVSAIQLLESSLEITTSDGNIHVYPFEARAGLEVPAPCKRYLEIETMNADGEVFLFYSASVDIWQESSKSYERQDFRDDFAKLINEKIREERRLKC